MSNESIVNFNSGEVTPDIDARPDIEKYTGGCRQCDNMIPDLYGNATRRPGTELIQVGNGSGCYYLTPTPDPAKTQIYTAQDLQDMQNTLDGDYELMNNIDMEGFSWTPVGDFNPGVGGSKFTGTFDGNYFTISNLTIDKGVDFGYVGMFGYALSAEFSNVIIKDITIHSYKKVGALAGYIENCNINLCGSTGIIYLDRSSAAGCSEVGGLVGLHTIGAGSNGDFIKSWSTVDIVINYNNNSDSQVGGLIGQTGGKDFEDCWAGGDLILSGGEYLRPYAYQSGGLFGDAQTTGQPERCHSYGVVVSSGNPVTNQIGGFSGAIDSPTDCHWDITTSTLDYGNQGGNIAGLTGHTTSVSQQQATYTNWDFDDVWEIDEGNGYPTLRWVKDEGTKRQICYPL